MLLTGSFVVLCLAAWALAGLLVAVVVTMIFGEKWLDWTGNSATLTWLVVILIGPVAWFAVLCGGVSELLVAHRERNRRQ